MTKAAVPRRGSGSIMSTTGGSSSFSTNTKKDLVEACGSRKHQHPVLVNSESNNLVGGTIGKNKKIVRRSSNSNVVINNNNKSTNGDNSSTTNANGNGNGNITTHTQNTTMSVATHSYNKSHSHKNVTKNHNNKKGVQNAGSQVRVLDAGVKLCARKYNDCKVRCDQVRQQIGSKRDTLNELKREAEALEGMRNPVTNPDAQRIAKLHADIDSAQRRSQEKLRYRWSLKHLLSRQQKNSVSLDSHMGALTDTLMALEKERDRCERLAGEAASELTRAQRQLDDLRRTLEVDRTQRSRALREKRAEAANAERIESWRHEREVSRKAFETSVKGSRRRELDKRRRTLGDKQSRLDELNAEMERRAGELSVLEEAFTDIKRATGVNSLSEMVDKISNHQEHKDRLLEEKKEAEERLAAAKRDLALAHQTYNRVKAVGFGDDDSSNNNNNSSCNESPSNLQDQNQNHNHTDDDTDILSRESLNRIHEAIAKEKTKGKIAKSTTVRLEGVLMELRQGIVGLYQRLLPYHPTLLDGNDNTNTNMCEESVTTTGSNTSCAHAINVDDDSDTLEMLAVTSHILEQMLESVGGINTIMKNDTATHNATTPIPPFDREAPPHNESEARIKSVDTNTNKTTTFDQTLENPNLGENNCRIQPRRPSLSITFDGDKDNDDYDNDSEDSQPLHDESDVSGENKVLTRAFLKSCSEKQAGEAKRQKELEEKRKKLREKECLDDDNQGARMPGDREALTPAALRKKQQAEANSRMAQQNVPPGLPKSFSFRDDPLKKAQAFLTETPNLE